VFSAAHRLRGRVVPAPPLTDADPGPTPPSAARRGTQIGAQIGLTVDAIVLGVIAYSLLHGLHHFDEALEEDFGPP
jgi:hypothetical protein